MKNIKSIAEILAAAPVSSLPEKVDLSGWNSDHPIFDKLIVEAQPKVIIEVGSWKGRSAMHMAHASSSLKELCEISGSDVPVKTQIYCVDTWLGGIDHITSDKPHDDLMRDKFNSPEIYHQFLRNFIEAPEFAKRIFPIRNTSLNGARFLAKLGVKSELVYIDGSHEYDDVYADLCAYSQLLRPGGLLFGDDFRNFGGVFAAVLRFAHETGRKLEEVDNNFWILR